MPPPKGHAAPTKYEDSGAGGGKGAFSPAGGTGLRLTEYPIFEPLPTRNKDNGGDHGQEMRHKCLHENRPCQKSLTTIR